MTNSVQVVPPIMFSSTCPDCGKRFRKPVRPKEAMGAAVYMLFCPHCGREMVYGAGVRVRIALIFAIVVAYFLNLFDFAGPTMGTVLRIAAMLALVAAWILLPAWSAGKRRYSEETRMAEEVEEDF